MFEVILNKLYFRGYLIGEVSQTLPPLVRREFEEELKNHRPAMHSQLAESAPPLPTRKH